MRVALDTNAYSAMSRGQEAIIDTLERADAVRLPFVVIGELRAGFAAGTKGAVNERGLVRFTALPDVSVLHSSDATSRHYATLYRQLREQGTPIPTNALWIAALVIEHDLALCSLDAHFDRLPQIRIV